MNFGSGNGLIIPTTDEPEHFDSSASLISFPVPANGVSNPHMVLPYGDEILVPDLGADKIWRLTEDGSPGNWKINGFIEQPQGSGPRHIAILDDQLYTIHEHSSTLTLQNIPPSPINTAAPLIANVSIIPSDPPTGAKFAAAEILIPPTTDQFTEPYIYVSNRNIGTTDARGDSIAIYQRVTTTTPSVTGRRSIRTRQSTTVSLELVAQVYTGLDQIRGMQIGRVEDGGVEFLVASGVVGTGGVVVFQRTEGGRNLVEVARNQQIPTRTSFVWV